MAIVARGIHRRPDDTLDRICEAIRRRGGVVPALDEEWRLHVPGGS